MLAITGLYDRDHAEHAPEELTHHAIAAGHSQYVPRPCSTVQRAPSSSSGMKTAPRAASSCRTWLRPSQAPTGRHRRPCPTAARPGKEPPDEYELPHFKKHNEPYITMGARSTSACSSAAAPDTLDWARRSSARPYARASSSPATPIPRPNASAGATSTTGSHPCPNGPNRWRSDTTRPPHGSFESCGGRVFFRRKYTLSTPSAYTES